MRATWSRRLRQPPVAVLASGALVTCLLSPALQASDSQPAPAPDSDGIYAPAPESDPSPCSTCGTGMVATGLLATLPLTFSAALTLLILTQVDVIDSRATAVMGLPLWGVAAGCAVGHACLGLAASASFVRDGFGLCASLFEEEEEPEVTLHARAPDTIPPAAADAQLAGDYVAY